MKNIETNETQTTTEADIMASNTIVNNTSADSTVSVIDSSATNTSSEEMGRSTQADDIEDTELTEETPVNDFENFALSDEVLNSIKKLKYASATPIQKACIPYLLENDSDIVALAKTGTGKTAAFGIPLVEKIEAGEGLQGLVLCPTRELAQQVALNIKNFGDQKRLKVTTILGGESYDKQIRSLKAKPEIIVSTPGRLIDLIEQNLIDLEGVNFLILDEADEMLSFGFQDALEEILKSIEQPFNTWLFSATMSENIKKLSKKYLKNAHEVKLNTKEEKINVESFAAVVFEEDKEDALSLLIKNEPEFYGIIFATTKKQVADLEIKLRKLGLDVDSLHGDKVQAERTRTINRMKSRHTKILVATDVAARGLDIQDLTHVVNFEIPWDVETYTHRIGRTARAGKTGVVWTMVRPKESIQLRKFERALGLEFKNLVIPTVEQVQIFQKVKWLKEIASRPFRESEFVKFEKAIGSIEDENVQELSLETRKWLVKAFQFFGEGEELHMKQPRALELKKAGEFEQRGGRSGDRGGYGGSRGGRGFGGGRSGGGRGYRGSRDEGRSGGRSERSDRGESRSYSSGEGRSYSSRDDNRGNSFSRDDRNERGGNAGFRRSRSGGDDSSAGRWSRSDRGGSDRGDSGRGNSDRPARSASSGSRRPSSSFRKNT